MFTQQKQQQHNFQLSLTILYATLQDKINNSYQRQTNLASRPATVKGKKEEG